MNKDSKLIFEAYQDGKKSTPLVKEASENPSPTSSTNQIEQEIYALLKKNGIQTSPFHVGDEDCWSAISSISDRADLKRAQDLVKQYQSAYHKEKIIKPHLQPPV